MVILDIMLKEFVLEYSKPQKLLVRSTVVVLCDCIQ